MKRLVAASLVFALILAPAGLQGAEKAKAKAKAKPVKKTVVPGAKATKRVKSNHAVSWSNHLSPEATRIKVEMERLTRAGDPPTERLQLEWREKMEDMLWAMANSPEFVFVP